MDPCTEQLTRLRARISVRGAARRVLAGAYEQHLGAHERAVDGEERQQGIITAVATSSPVSADQRLGSRDVNLAAFINSRARARRIQLARVLRS